LGSTSRGAEFLKVDQYDSAISDLNLATQLSPRLPEAFANLGVAYFNTDQYKLSVQLFSQAIVLGQKYKGQGKMRHYLGRAAAYEAMGWQREAIADYRVTCRLANKGCEKI